MNIAAEQTIAETPSMKITFDGAAYTYMDDGQVEQFDNLADCCDFVRIMSEDTGGEWWAKEARELWEQI